MKEKRIEMERANFRHLILKNPNYFGNVKPSPFKPVTSLTNNTVYEEVACLGFNPQFDRLEAVVLVKQESGYLGDVCSIGTPEYVRFYIDWDNDGNWVDHGMVNFTAYDIPGDKPLEYDVTLEITPTEKWCSVENLPTVRAILSWNNPPPPDDPGFTPVWGNAVNAQIQIEPSSLMSVAELLEMAKAELSTELLATIDPTQPVPAPEPKMLTVPELAELYADKDIPEHRFAFPEVQKLISKPTLTSELMGPGYVGTLAELGIDMDKLIGQLMETDGDTSYEQLECVGLNSNEDTLVGILTVKLPYGYAGGLCKGGSHEYVAFWEWDQIEQMWLYLGTASVKVHDISGIPAAGLQYAVFLPVNLSRHHRPCGEGPRVVEIRAILSWATPPPPADPNWVPTWGNREETLIHIKPGEPTPADDHSPIIETVASMGVDDIDPATGLADGGSGGTASFTAYESPFGGEIRITGRILNPPDSFTGGIQELRYKVSVRRSGVGETWQPLTNSFDLKLATLVGGIYTGPFTHRQEVVEGTWYKYLVDLNGPEKRFVPIPLLAVWKTSGDMTGLWQIHIDAYDPTANQDWAGSQIIKLHLDQKAPKAEITVTGVSRNGGPVEAADPCDKFKVDDVIYGEYEVHDEDGHFRVLTLDVRPGPPSHGATPNPPSRSYPTVPGTGESGTWTLDTAGMDPCGYVVHLWTEDRTIVNGGYIGWGDHADVGFCLEASPT